MKTLVTIPLCALGLLLGACSSHWSANDNHVSSTFHDVVPVASARSVQVTNVSGYVRIVPWNRQNVEIDAVMHAASVDAIRRLHIDVQPGDVIQIKTRYGDGGFLNIGSGNNGSVDYTIHSPANLAMTVTNVAGDVTLKGINSDVTVRDVSGTVQAESVDCALDLTTTSGDIFASVVSVKPPSHLRLASVSGSITLTVPKNTAAGVKAGSVSGDFSSTFPIKSVDRTIGASVNDRINGGSDAQITFSTVSGAMTLNGK